MNFLEIRHCRVLLAVSEHGSVSAAARALGLAQSTISEALLSLERTIGAPVLIRRRGKGAALTLQAQTLLPHARALVSASAAALAAVASAKRTAIRLGTVESISTFLLPPVLDEFRRRWPLADVQITVGVCEDLRGRVRRDELDVALTLEGAELSRPNADGWSHVLAPARLRLFVSARKAPGSARVRRADLAQRTFLLPDAGGPFASLLRGWFAGLGHEPRIESAGTIDGVKSSVCAGDYVGVLPTYALSNDLASGAIEELQVREPLPAIALWLTVRHQPLEGSALHDMIRGIEGSLERGCHLDRIANRRQAACGPRPRAASAKRKQDPRWPPH